MIFNPIFDWCLRGISLSFEQNFNGYTISVFMKTTCIFYDKNENVGGKKK
jgi:hypothetical protein